MTYAITDLPFLATYAWNNHVPSFLENSGTRWVNKHPRKADNIENLASITNFVNHCISMQSKDTSISLLDIQAVVLKCCSYVSHLGLAYLQGQCTLEESNHALSIINQNLPQELLKQTFESDPCSPKNFTIVCSNGSLEIPDYSVRHLARENNYFKRILSSGLSESVNELIDFTSLDLTKDEFLMILEIIDNQSIEQSIPRIVDKEYDSIKSFFELLQQLEVFNITENSYDAIVENALIKKIHEFTPNQIAYTRGLTPESLNTAK